MDAIELLEQSLSETRMGRSASRLYLRQLVEELSITNHGSELMRLLAAALQIEKQKTSRNRGK